VASRAALTAAQLALRERPSGSPVMYQRWRSLLFLHFPCPPAEIQELLPSGLTVDTFPDESGDEMAWVGLVPFRMEGVRPRFAPPAPGLSAFPETNVRTYVHRDGAEPGVWFFSLDAANRIACWAARSFFSLPYHHADMNVIESGDNRHYESRRYSDAAALEAQASFGAPLPLAEPGSLEFFLIERYLLYSERGGQLLSGQVHHRPYPLRTASISVVEESLTKAAGISRRPFIHSAASDGVDVEVFPLKA